MTEFFKWGQPSASSDVQNDLLLAYVHAAERQPFINILELRQRDQNIGLVLEFNVERPQYPPVPILYNERILISFDEDQNKQPYVLALRKDFPDTGHQNLRDVGEPQSLCLFEESFDNILPFLTPPTFLNRIADWLRRASVEELHLSDQPLEPLFFSNEKVVIDPRLFDEIEDPDKPILVVRITEKPLLLYASPQVPTEFGKMRGPKIYALPIETQPWHARSIRHRPTTLEQLSELFKELGVDIQNRVQSFIWVIAQKGKLQELEDAVLLIVMKLPKTRTANGEIEKTEWWAFLLETPMSKLSRMLGLMDQVDGEYGVLVGSSATKELGDAPVQALQPLFALTPTVARTISGLPDIQYRITVFGVGALGSQVVFNLARQGYAIWTLIDHDRLYPHNFSRHALSGAFLGLNKAQSLAIDITRTLNFEAVAEAIPSNILNCEPETRENIIESFTKANLILDFSTSSAVSRFLSYQDDGATRLTAFLTPSGRYLVALKEDRERTRRINDLEQQMAVQIADTSVLQDLYLNEDGTYAYAGACRDVTTVLSNDNMMLFAAVLSKYIKSKMESPNADLRIWELANDTSNIITHDFEVCPIEIFELNGWQIRTSKEVIDRMHSFRKERLPNETGGVLLGRMDYAVRKIFVSYALPSPPDSEEWPTSYRRGVIGLDQQIENLKAITGEELTYIGEWHSHPTRAGVEPSQLDQQALLWLADEMGAAGLPGLIAIIGDEELPNYIFVDVNEND